MGCSGRSIPPAAAAQRRPPRAVPGGGETGQKGERIRQRHAGGQAGSCRGRVYRGEKPSAGSIDNCSKWDIISWRGGIFRCDRRSRSIGQRGSQRYRIRRIRHLQFPTGRLAAAAAQQLDPPPRAPHPGLPAGGRDGKCRDAPAGRGRIRQHPLARRLPAIAPAPQQKSGDAGALLRRAAGGGSPLRGAIRLRRPLRQCRERAAPLPSPTRSRRRTAPGPAQDARDRGHGRQDRGRKDPGGASTTTLSHWRTVREYERKRRRRAHRPPRPRLLPGFRARRRARDRRPAMPGRSLRCQRARRHAPSPAPLDPPDALTKLCQQTSFASRHVLFLF